MVFSRVVQKCFSTSILKILNVLELTIKSFNFKKNNIKVGFPYQVLLSKMQMY